MNEKPEFIKGEIIKNVFDGVTDDLLTAGFGKTGLAEAAFQPKQINAESLRKLAIFNNYKGLLDFSTGGGFGVFYGPNVAPDGSVSEKEGMISGKEYLAFADDGDGEKNVTMMVQIPDAFDIQTPCIVAAPSSGSRGVYGAVGVVGEWALKRGFAVAYTDKGTGVGIHDLEKNTVNLITGERVHCEYAGKRSHFTADFFTHNKKSAGSRIAIKHAHSRQNPEAEWAKHVLQSIEFAFFVLNLEENFGKKRKDGTVEATLRKENTIVIASGVSNGGGASIRAAEMDDEGLIDAIAVSEPNVCPDPDPSVVVRQGNTEWIYPEHSKNILDYMTLIHIYQPCANLAPELRGKAPMGHLDENLCIARCNALKAKGLLQGESIEQMARHAQKIINGYGILREQNYLQPSHFANYIVEGICVTYANAYGKFGAEDNLCGYSFAAVDKDTRKPASWHDKLAERSFGDGNGIAPSAGVDIINDWSASGPVSNRDSLSDSGEKDMNLEGALCLRSLITGKNENGEPLRGKMRKYSERISQGISAVRAKGDVKGAPLLIVHGRNDAILPPNHTSRPYAALNSLMENENGKLRYYEVANAHHLDAYNAFPGFDALFVPLQFYLIQALNLAYEHIFSGRNLPPSQVIRTQPRGIDAEGNVAPLTKQNIPPISENPKYENRIYIFDGKIHVPE